MEDVRVPHAASGLVTSENKEIEDGETIRGAESFPATREYYRFIAESSDLLNSINQLMPVIQSQLDDIEARLTAGGL